MLARALLQEAVNLFAGEAPPGVKISCNASADLPEYLLGNPVRLWQVLFNLAGNAVKFTADGTIELRADLDGEWLRLEVVDTGTGIAPEKVDRVFDRFVQGDDTSTRKNGGSGTRTRDHEGNRRRDGRLDRAEKRARPQQQIYGSPARGACSRSWRIRGETGADRRGQ
ncbi:MAG: hypothetical protein FJW32_07145 [Acidobacteria bacterium]|nr:hypothetical protein [Acidobacteriota bacterium]